MQGRFHFAAFPKLLSIALAAGTLSGCLSEGSDGTSPLPDVASDHELTGSVGDGPIVGASMRVVANDGSMVSEFESDSTAGYNVVIRTKGKNYPLTLRANDGIDLVTNLVPDFALSGVVGDPGKKTIANLNPFSTFAYELAMDLGAGLDKTNVANAERIVVQAFNCGLSTIVQTGPMATPIDAGNAAEMVRAAEALGEIVRRTRDNLSLAGTSVNGDQVVGMLASDLTDEVINGSGGARADARASAISIIASAGIMLESMANELHVYGTDAGDAMQAAIETIVTGTPDKSLTDLTVTAGMLQNARKGVEIAAVVSGDARVTAILNAVSGIQPGTEPMLVRSLLPADYRQVMNDMLSLVAFGDDALIAEVNRMATEGVGGLDPQPNQAPQISGNPPGQVEAGQAYRFAPSASDADNDALSFSAVRLPGWLALDDRTGTISGTPQSASVGVYQGIEIVVSDGTDTARLGPFSIEVTAAPGGGTDPAPNQPPQISGNPQAQVEAGQTYRFTPNASDADNDSLSFSAVRLPGWLALDTRTGTISGTPSSADVGLYDGIEIIVSDGTDTARLGPFAVEVTAAGSQTGSVTLTWTAPTQNTDGTTLTDIAGYRIYWGTQPGSYPNSATIDNPGVTTYVIDNLAPGSYEFVATAFDADGVESGYSNSATKTVP